MVWGLERGGAAGENRDRRAERSSKGERGVEAKGGTVIYRGQFRSAKREILASAPRSGLREMGAPQV